MDTTPDWGRLRRLVSLDADTINLNTGTLAPTPLPVLEAVGKLRRRMAESPSHFCWRVLPELLVASRQALAGFLNVPSRELLLLPNVTFALNLAMTSLELPEGSAILTTDHEYGAMRFLLDRLAGERRWAVDVVRLPYDSDAATALVDAFRNAIRPETRAIFFSHVASPTGLILPAQAICRLAAERDLITVIDGAHAPGMIPVDLGELGADFYGANCHKWMMAPSGAGFLHVANGRRKRLVPQITSWGWDYERDRADADSGWGGTFWQRNFEFHGTLDRCPQLVLPETLAFRAHLGGEAAIRRRMLELADYARLRLQAAGLKPAVAPKLCGALVAFEFPKVDPVKARNWIWNVHRIEAPVTTAAGRHFLRVSTCWFNTEEEIDRLADVVPRYPISKLA